MITDLAGNMYIADSYNSRIRKINTAGIITTIAGNGTFGFSGDGGPATAAELDVPYRLALDAAGNIYLSDADNNRIRKINTTTGIITTVAGNGTAGFTGDGGQATAAELNIPAAITIDLTGNIYVIDGNNNRIRKINTVGIITTIAGNGTNGYTGDGGQATAAELKGPSDLTLDGTGNIYISDAPSGCVRKINTSGVITTIVGNGAGGYGGDGGLAINAQLSNPYGVAIDASGYLYIADQANERLRIVSPPITVTATATVNSPTVCPGSTSTLTAGGAATLYTWAPATGLSSSTGISIIATPSVTTTYTLTGTIPHTLYGNPVISEGIATALINVYVPPTISVNTATICVGATATLMAGGATTYTWNTTATTASITVTPTLTSTYTVTGTDGNHCTNKSTATVVVNALPIISVNTATICAGAIATLTATGAVTYTWSTGAIATSITPSPTVATNYTVTGTDANNCKNKNTTTVALYVPPIISINTATVCSGNSATLTAGGASTYTWNTTVTTASITASPTVTTTYTVTGTDLNHCTNKGTTTVMVNTLPNISVNTATVCIGDTAILTAAGANTYTWSTTATTTSITASPILTSTYTVTGTDANHCKNIATTKVTVNALPIVSITASTSTLCTGASTTLTASGASTYTWNTAATGSIIKPSPTTTTVYDVTGTDLNNCSNAATKTITVNDTPVISVNSATICVGATASITASGASTYTWNFGATGATIIPSPTVTTTYTVTGSTAANCKSKSTATVKVNTLPLLSITVGSVSVCIGGTTTLTANGANTYTWSTGVMGSMITVQPTTTTNYTVTGMDANNCMNTDTLSIITENCNTTGIDQVSHNDNQVVAYPNPNNGRFTIELVNAVYPATFVMCDINGREIVSRILTDRSVIDVSDLNEGIYNIRILSNQGMMHKKVIIVK